MRDSDFAVTAQQADNSDSEEEIEEIEVESGYVRNDNDTSVNQTKINSKFPISWQIVENFDSKLVREIIATHGNLAALLHIRLEMFGFKLSQETLTWLEGLNKLFDTIISSIKVEDLKTKRVCLDCIPSYKELKWGIRLADNLEVYKSVVEFLVRYFERENSFTEDSYRHLKRAKLLKRMLSNEEVDSSGQFLRSQFVL